MIIVIGADVDPRLPGMRRLPDWDPWDPLDRIPHLESALGADLPPITWLLRADDTIRHVTGAFDSGFMTRQEMWTRLQGRGHELGWHFHHWTYAGAAGGFDPNPSWLSDAHASLSRHFAIRATRTGWDYCNSITMRRLSELDVAIDFSSLPGQMVWWSIEGERILVDWKRAPGRPYRPAPADYQQPRNAREDELRIWELPIATFRAPAATMAKRAVWRLLHGEVSFTGLSAKTLMITQPWPDLPKPAGVLAFHFHPEELTPDGIAAFSQNLALLKDTFNPEFVTASDAARRLANGRGVSVP